MPRNSSISMFGGAGGRGARASVSTLQGLRSVLSKDAPREAALSPVVHTMPLTSASPVDTPPSLDDKQTLRGLNSRLSGYLNRVKQLQKENQDLETQIADIEAKREAPEGRDWEQILGPLNVLNQQIKELTQDNAKMLLQIDNSRLANQDFKSKLEDEKRARMELEKDLEELKKDIENTKEKKDLMLREIKEMEEDRGRLHQDHREDVKELRKKIKESNVRVDIEAEECPLGDVVKGIRIQYEKMAQKNLKETDDWYKKKFDTIQVQEAQNTEELQSGKMELKRLLKQKKSLEIQIMSKNVTITSLEDSLLKAKQEKNFRLEPLIKAMMRREADLKDARAKVEKQSIDNKNLLGIKQQLEEEIRQYDILIDPSRYEGLNELNIENALPNAPPRPELEDEPGSQN